VQAVNLLSVAGVQRICTETARNFVNFPPLGVSLMCLLGIGVAEHSGLVGAGLRLLVLNAARAWITPIVIFVGLISNVGSEIGYVLVTPLGAVLFHALGRHPLVGLAAAFAGVSAGYSANVLIAPVDVLLSGLTQAAARIVAAGHIVRPTATYYFMAASAVVLTLVGTWITEKIVAPRLGDYRAAAPREPVVPLAPHEKRGLGAALAAVLLLGVLVLAGVLPAGGFLQAESARFSDSVLMTSLATFILIFTLVPGIVYGLVAGTLRSDHDVVRGMTEAMKSLASYLVLAFFAAQFIAYFHWTNLGVITAVGGARFIAHLGLHESPTVLMLAVVVFAGLANLVLASASAKWALMAPVLVPMFMLLGYAPELVQAAYGIGDSVTNVITPMLGYFPLVLAFAQRYEPKAGLGTVVALMLPYSLAFLLVWSALLVAWIAFGLPVGPGAPLFLK
jgi:aminobenzoyl-glutamate transport protein